jgi:AcrR family transcriptional regulator
MAIKKSDDGSKVSTRQRLIDLAIIELDKNGPTDFDLDGLLESSKISKGSLYHHFGNKKGFIVAAEMHLLVANYDQGNRLLRLVVESAIDKREFSAALELIVQTATNSQSNELRRRRIRALALAQHNPVLAQEIKKYQIEGSNYLAETMHIAVSKGWLRADLNLRAFSYWQQAMFFGHALLDTSEDDTLHDDWNSVALQSLKSFLTTD